MATADQIVEYLNVGLFTLLALAAVREWQRGRGRPAFWAAVTFGSIGLVLLSGLVIPDEPTNELEEFAVRVDLALLVLYPYLLYRFTTTFERATAGLERFLGLMTIVLLVWTFALPDIPSEDESWTTSFQLYLVAFLIHWSVLSIVSAVRLWRAGRGQPSVARRRMRFLAAAAVAITAGILLAGLNPTEDSPLSLTVGILASLSGLGFLLGLVPPTLLRMIWRRPEIERLQAAVADLMAARTPQDVTSGVLPPMLGIVGAQAIQLCDSKGKVVAEHRLQEGPPPRETEELSLDLTHGSLRMWTSRHAPFFGREELDLLRTLGTLTELALDRARLFSQEQDARRALEDADELKMNFISLAAHELRTPVAVIHGVVETIERRGGELAPERRQELEEMLRAQAVQLKLLVEQLLDLSRLDAHAVAIEPERIAVRERVEEIVAVSAGERLPEVQVSVSGELEATVDPAAFDRILTNLVTNALRYGRPPILVSATHANGQLEVAVEDRGEGVAPEFVPKLFERFSRSDPSRRRMIGTGLGLAIAHSYAEAHDGELRYREALPHGARFELVLPSAA